MILTVVQAPGRKWASHVPHQKWKLHLASASRDRALKQLRTGLKWAARLIGILTPTHLTSLVISNSLSPVGSPDRIKSLDVLRGFALLGILVMNIQSFGFIDAKYLNPTAMGELSTTSYFCWWCAHVFFDLKFMATFSILFGAGVILMWERAKSAGRGFTRLHYSRMFWLLLLGLAHAHLLWIGDILYAYALCGMLVFWLRGLKPRWLILVGIVLLSIGSGISIVSGLTLPYAQEEQIAELAKDWTPTESQINFSLAVYRGSWLEAQPHRSATAFEMETFVFLFLFVWRVGGLMLIGMSLFKLGVLSGLRSDRFYLLGACLAMITGLTLVLTGVHFHEKNHWSLEYSFLQGGQFNYWGSVLISLSYICFVVVACKRHWLSKAQKPLAAVGQMALTNYLMHTIICTTIFYGHGLGWYGYLNRPQLIGIVVVIWCVQLIASPIWLKHFRFGPFEWLWRSLSYWRLQPLRKGERVLSASNSN